MFLGKKITLQYVSFVRCECEWMRTTDMILQLSSRLLLVNHSFTLMQIVPEWKHWITLMTEKRSCRSFLAIPMLVQRFWSTILLCRAWHQSSAFSALAGGLILTPRRNKLCNSVFQQLLVLKTNADIWSATLMTIMTWNFPGLELLKDLLFCLLRLKHFNIRWTT